MQLEVPHRWFRMLEREGIYRKGKGVQKRVYSRKGILGVPQGGPTQGYTHTCSSATSVLLLSPTFTQDVHIRYIATLLIGQEFLAIHRI